MAGLNSLDAVKRKIQTLQQQADEAEDQAQMLQRELDAERELREKVRRKHGFRVQPRNSYVFCLLLGSCGVFLLSFSRSLAWFNLFEMVPLGSIDSFLLTARKTLVRPAKSG